MAAKTTDNDVVYDGGLNRTQVVRWRNSLFLVFALCGIGIASWAARIPAIALALHADTQQLGILLFGISVGSLTGLTTGGHIVVRIGAARTVVWGLTIGAIGFSIVALSTLPAVGAALGPAAFVLAFVGLFFFGSAMGMCEVPINVSGAANERVSKRSIMPIFHAFFSIGTMVGAGIAALAEFLGVPLLAHMLFIAVVQIVLVQVAVRGFQSEHIVPDGEEALPDDHASKTFRGRMSVWKSPTTILVGLIVLGMAFAEGSAGDWLAYGMVKGHETDKVTAAIAFGVFVAAMTTGRLLGVRLLDRFGRVPVLRGSAILAGLGLLIFIFVPITPMAFVAVAMWGLGSALGFPVGMSAAADDPKMAAARVSAVATVGYLAFLAGPPLIGFLGQQFATFLPALLVVLVLVAISGSVSFAAREGAGRATTNRPKSSV
jgi:MFS family permease